MSKVSLLEVSKIPKGFLAEQMKGAEDGLAFFFLIIKNKDINGLFTLTETRDFQLNGRSYAEESERSLKVHIEPQTFTEKVSNFFSKKRPDLRALVEPPSDENSTVMVIFIGGKQLPNTGNANITIKVGWNKEVEPFQYKLSLTEIMAPHCFVWI